ncbi:MAG TPA: hypothetical protein VKG45_11030 [Actinomycetes bacterium]|nr:hypothetical protein [Actinomycetes bacterium]
MLLPTLAAMVVLLAAVCASLGAAWRALAEERPAPRAERSGAGDSHPAGGLGPPYWAARAWAAPAWLADEER